MTRPENLFARGAAGAAVAAALGGLAALGALAPRAARAQNGEPAAERVAPRQHRDLTFASELAYGRGWYDLAYLVLDELEKNRRAGAETQTQARLLRADILVREAGELRDRAKAAQKIAAAREIYEALARGSGPAATEAQLRTGEMYITEGEAASSRAKAGEDAEARAQARAEAEQKFQAAVKFFDDLVKKYEDATAPEDVYKLMIARFHRARATYFLAALPDRGAQERDRGLKEAAAAFNEVNFEHADHPIGYEAAIFLGHVRKELGDIKGALDAFTSAIALKDFFAGADGKYHLDPAMADIVARGYYFKAQTLNEAKEHQKAIDTVKELFSVLPDYPRQPLGMAARIEAAKATAGLGDMKRAIQELEKIAAENPASPEAGLARATIGQLQGGGAGGAAAAPDRSLAAAKDLIERGRAVDGLHKLRLLIADLESAGGEEATKWLPACWYELGRAYLDLGRYDEAVAAFEALAERFKDAEQAPNALFSKSIALSNLNGAKPNPFDDRRYEETLKRLSSGYPAAPAAKASAYLLGNKKFMERDYAAAAREFEKVTPAAGEYYDAALYQIGIAHIMQGRRLASEKKTAEARIAFAAARSALEKAIAWAAGGAAAAEPGGLKPEREATLRRVAFRARLRLAEVYLVPGMQEPARALEAAAAAEEGLGPSPDPEQVAEARLLVAQAHIAAGDLDRAEEAQSKLAAAAPDSPRRARGHRELAVAFDGAIEAARKARKPDAEIARLRERCADQYAAWAEVSRRAELPVPGSDYVRAGDRLYALALELNGLPETASFSDVDDPAALPAMARFGQAAAAYEAALDVGGVPEPWLVRVKLQQCLGFGGNWETSVAVFEPLVQSEKLLREEKDPQGKPVLLLDPRALEGKKGILLFAYADYANALLRLANRDRARLDAAADAIARVVTAAPPGTQIWWRGKYDYFVALFKKGAYEEGLVGLKAIERLNPEFDGGKYGLKGKFFALKQEFEKRQPLGGRGR